MKILNIIVAVLGFGAVAAFVGQPPAAELNVDNVKRLMKGGAEVTGTATFNNRVVTTVQAVTVADNPADGGTVPAAATLTPTGAHARITCSDADGCDITMSETGAVDGQLLTVTNVSTPAVNFADTSGVSETASTFAAGQYDSITFIYASDRWVEVSRSNN